MHNLLQEALSSIENVRITKESCTEFVGPVEEYQQQQLEEARDKIRSVLEIAHTKSVSGTPKRSKSRRNYRHSLPASFHNGTPSKSSLVEPSASASATSPTQQSFPSPPPSDTAPSSGTTTPPSEQTSQNLEPAMSLLHPLFGTTFPAPTPPPRRTRPASSVNVGTSHMTLGDFQMGLGKGGFGQAYTQQHVSSIVHQLQQQQNDNGNNYNINNGGYNQRGGFGGRPLSLPSTPTPVRRNRDGGMMEYGSLQAKMFGDMKTPERSIFVPHNNNRNNNNNKPMPAMRTGRHIAEPQFSIPSFTTTSDRDSASNINLNHYQIGLMQPSNSKQKERDSDTDSVCTLVPE
ncbi:hypothetical protein HK102_011569, partial [Quaeritorhiza haematococci]